MQIPKFLIGLVIGILTGICLASRPFYQFTPMSHTIIRGNVWTGHAALLTQQGQWKTIP